MENSSDTIGSWEESPPPALSSDRGPKVREWSQFELDTVCALICKHEHREIPKRRSRRGGTGGKDSDEDWALMFATKLNEALHGVGEYRYDIAVTDVRELMDFIATKHQLFMAYIGRQSTPFRITRSKKYAFQRLCNDFNNALYEWTIRHRERCQDTSISTDKEMPRANWLDRYLSSPNQDAHLLGAARIHKIMNAEFSTPSERGWMSNSAYAQRNREGLNINSTSSSAPKVHSPQRPIVAARPARSGHRRRNQRRTIPLPPPRPLSSQPTQYEHMTSYEGIGADMHSHPTSPAYYVHLDPALSASPYPPTSPAYFNHAELRQSIHPMGPGSETPVVLASPVYQYSGAQQTIYPMDRQLDAPSFFTSPVHSSVSHPTFMGYQYPEPSQENGGFDYGSVLQTPASPSSPMYFPDAVPAEMTGAPAGEENPSSYLGDLLGQPNFDVSPFGYGEYSPNY
ncbi:hypothetical protein F4803DRAFT_568654 [Xylaria telfairii]|nr:hypothetical protein F4803DRAFT_568654 [Xylaria telfairii]